MDQVVFIRLALFRLEDAIGAMIGEIVLVIAKQSARPRTFPFEILVTLVDIARNAAGAGTTSGRENMEEDSHRDVPPLLCERVLFDHAKHGKFGVGWRT